MQSLSTFTTQALGTTLPTLFHAAHTSTSSSATCAAYPTAIMSSTPPTDKKPTEKPEEKPAPATDDSVMDAIFNKPMKGPTTGPYILHGKTQPYPPKRIPVVPVKRL
ncbi:uncharacterized protein EV422DRAFT_570711 [Fimicolochytrium jonesii]|uniref:uncharacterized protein n=1 Tax=Fimicolochytrium jonesii TaxID=1396493 RepID=UPI0022FDBF9E|nr:uncharacterized protein EV422DRAFT_570711 [Fimicolochytrium jonesii]KAI8817368.1 hypothetical protein EV422DRAFT_570711 [Fimicolochytrium jonesii]